MHDLILKSDLYIRYFAIVTMRQYLDDVGLVNNVIAMVEKKFMVSNAVKLLLNNSYTLSFNDKNKIV